MRGQLLQLKRKTKSVADKEDSDFSRLESDVKILSKELQALLDTAQKTTAECVVLFVGIFS